MIRERIFGLYKISGNQDYLVIKDSETGLGFIRERNENGSFDVGILVDEDHGQMWGYTSEPSCPYIFCVDENITREDWRKLVERYKEAKEDSNEGQVRRWGYYDRLDKLIYLPMERFFHDVEKFGEEMPTFEELGVA